MLVHDVDRYRMAWRRYDVGGRFLSFDCQRNVEDPWPSKMEPMSASDMIARISDWCARLIVQWKTRTEHD